MSINDIIKQGLGESFATKYGLLSDTPDTPINKYRAISESIKANKIKSIMEKKDNLYNSIKAMEAYLPKE